MAEIQILIRPQPGGRHPVEIKDPAAAAAFDLLQERIVTRVLKPVHPFRIGSGQPRSDPAGILYILDRAFHMNGKPDSMSLQNACDLSQIIPHGVPLQKIRRIEIETRLFQGFGFSQELKEGLKAGSHHRRSEASSGELLTLPSQNRSLPRMGPQVFDGLAKLFRIARRQPPVGT